EALTTAERSIAKLIAWRTRTSENTSDVVFMLMYVRQYAGASTTRSETLGSCRRGSVEACRVPEMAVASAPWPAIIRPARGDWSRPTCNSRAAGYGSRTPAGAG